MSVKCQICGLSITRMEHHMMAHVDHPDGRYFSRGYVARLRRVIEAARELLPFILDELMEGETDYERAVLKFKRELAALDKDAK